jgi:hypothetical protein
MFPYQPIVQLVDGKSPNSVCPADEGFREYVRGVMATIASHRPAHIMLDDDFRLMFRPGGGCACPLHLSRFERLYGKRMEREELLSLVSGRTEEGERASLAFVETQRDSLVECARTMRDAIDSVDPTIPGSFCCVSSSSEFGAEVAKIFAGKGHPSVLRIHNSRYSALGTKYFTQSFLRAAASIEKVAGKVDVVLAETDTCPQNRYSTSARSLHSHFTGSILEGANGAKHWITRLSAHEPASGRAYRKLLGRYRGFYETLAGWEGKGKTLVVTTQVAHEGSDMDVYRVGRGLKQRFDLLESYAMTYESILTKLMWILALTKEDEKIRELFYKTINYDSIG